MHKLTIADTVEERIVKMQEEKVSSALSFQGKQRRLVETGYLAASSRRKCIGRHQNGHTKEIGDGGLDCIVS